MAVAVARPAVGSRAMQQHLHPASLLFHFESEHEALQQQHHHQSETAAAHTASAKQRISFFCDFSAASFATRLSKDVIYYLDVLRREMGDADIVLLASRLAAVGHYVSARSGLGGGGASPFSQLRHEFLLVHGSGDFEGVEFIVDIHFREQFAISHPTER